jgi:uncharacterized protein
MIVPHTLLESATLDALIEDFVTRSGAVHGQTDVPLAEMTGEVRKQLENGAAEIVYDEQQESWTIVVRR